MVSTRQSCSSTTGGDHSSGETSSGGVKTRQSSGGGGGSTPAQNNSPSVLWQNVVIGESPNQPPNYLSKVHFLDLPQEIFDKIFGYVGYKSVSQLRLVCRQFDRVCSVILNSTFQRLQTQMLQRFQGIKAKMPRRESARRNHPLACESDIIETLHMRLTLLQMSFGKHIERKHCCFFAGEILDEVYRILLYIKVTPKLARPYRVTDELFDLSTMAMEYFKERIEPTLPEISYFGTDFLDFTNGLPTTANKTWMLDSPPHNSTKIEYESPGSNDERPIETTSPQPQSNTVLRKRIRKIKQGMKKYNSQLTLVKRELRTCKNKLSDQQKQFLEFASRMDEHDKKNEETSRKFSTLLQELNKCKTELQYWRSKFPHSSMCVSCGKLTSGCAGGAFTEELLSRSSSFGGQYMVASGQQAAALDDPQPSTSSSSPSSPISTPTHHSEEMVLQSSQPHQIASPPLNPNGINSIGGKKMSNVNEEINAVKANNHQMAIKRKLMIPNEPASGHSKKVKKSNSMLKLRSKRS